MLSKLHRTTVYDWFIHLLKTLLEYILTSHRYRIVNKIEKIWFNEIQSIILRVSIAAVQVILSSPMLWRNIHL